MASYESLSPETVVLVNLSGAGGPDGRITVNETLTLKELGVDFSSTTSSQAPVFPEQEIRLVASSPDLSPKQKTEKISKIVSAYNELAESFSKFNFSVEDAIINAVIDWLVNNRGFSRTDTENAPVIDENELQVTTVNLQEGVLFSVNGTAVWG